MVKLKTQDPGYKLTGLDVFYLVFMYYLYLGIING